MLGLGRSEEILLVHWLVEDRICAAVRVWAGWAGTDCGNRAGLATWSLRCRATSPWRCSSIGGTVAAIPSRALQCDMICEHIPSPGLPGVHRVQSPPPPKQLPEQYDRATFFMSPHSVSIAYA